MGQMVTLYCVVHGAAYERYAAQLLEDVRRHFRPAENVEWVVLPGKPEPNGDGWPSVSATRYRVALEHWPLLRGDHIFQIDADMRIVGDVGSEILADGITVTVHPGLYPGVPRENWPYERRPESTAYVPAGQGVSYHPGAFVGGRRAEFLALAHYVAKAVDDDIARGVHAIWYEESHLNRYLLDHPPALVLDKRYCWWDQQWGPNPAGQGAKVVHLDKTHEEFQARG